MSSISRLVGATKHLDPDEPNHLQYLKKKKPQKITDVRYYIIQCRSKKYTI